MVWITVSTAASTPGKAQTALEIASGTGYSLTVSSVMMPSVPSEPMKRRVRS
jgi:protein-L-isoaspartate O-methyltransferase